MKNLFLSKLESNWMTVKDKRILHKGLHLAITSKDIVHGIEHVMTLRDSYLAFKKAHSSRIKLDKRVMAQAIVFHDVWKTQARRSEYFLKVLFEEYFEGSRSADIYRGYAYNFNIDRNVIENVSYAITKHSTGTLFPRRTNEAKLLFDLDELEFFNIERFKKGFNNFKFGVDRKLAAAVTYLKLRSKRGFYFDWSHAMFENRKKRFLEGLDKLRAEISI